jgi:Holliday junction DNA helicase RuvB
VAVEKERLVSPKRQESEPVKLRPTHLSEMIGQNRVRDNVSILIQAAKAREEPLDHVLFYGPPGLGKTTLAHILSTEMGSNLKITSGPAIERAGDLAAILTNLQSIDVLFIDEIHRLGRAVEEILYPAMEEFALDLTIGKGPSARSIRLKLPKFTVVGATTRLALLTAPLRARFGAIHRLDFYDLASMEAIVTRAAGILEVEIDSDGVDEIACRARGTPRVALVAIEALALLDIDDLGLDDSDRRVLSTVIEKYDGGPVGLQTIAASLSEEPETIMDVVEPYLLQLGFIDRTPQGRVATSRAYEHLGLEPPPSAQARLPEM